MFFLILALRVGDSLTREGPGYATEFGMILNWDLTHHLTNPCWISIVRYNKAVSVTNFKVRRS